MPHCCKSYVDVQIQLTTETQFGNVALRFALSGRQFAIVMQSRIDYKANIFTARRIGWKLPGPKRIQMLFWDRSILVGGLTQQRGWTGGGGGTGVEGAESGVEGAESGVEGAESGGRGGGKRG